MGKRRHVTRAASLMLAALVSLVLLGAISGAASAQTSATITVKPSKTQLAPGETFTVNIVQNVSVPTLGAQGNLYFNPSVVNVVSVEVGADYADSQFIVGDASGGVTPTVDQAIADANSSGVLANIATFFLPGSGNVQPGEHDIAVVTMQAVAGASGDSPLKFDSRQIRHIDPGSGVEGPPTTQEVGFVTDPPDPTGAVLQATVQQSQVTVVSGATPAPTATAGPSISPTPKKTPKPISSSDTTPNPSLQASIKMTVTPDQIDVKSGGTADATVESDSPVAITGASFTLSYDKEKVAISAIAPGSDWKFTNEPNYDSTISRANEAGEVSLSLKQKTGADPVAAGKAALFTITFKPVSGDGSSDLKLSNGAVLDEDSNEIPIAALAEATEGGDSGGGGASIVLIAGAVLGLAVLGGGGFLTWRNMRGGNRWEE
jgi:hypothetical protein